MTNINGFSINFKNLGLMFALLNKARFKTLQNEINDQKGYFIAIHRLMIGIGFKK